MEELQPNLNFAEREAVLRASLDEVDEDLCVWTSVRFIMHGPRHPRVGEWVYLIDLEGGSCRGIVEELNGWMVRVRPDWGSRVDRAQL